MSQPKYSRKQIARERIDRLFHLAEQQALTGRMKLAHRYVALARTISMRYLVRLTSQQRRRICSHCYSYLMPGTNCRVRIGSRRLTITCQECGGIMRYPYRE